MSNSIRRGQFNLLLENILTATRTTTLAKPAPAPEHATATGHRNMQRRTLVYMTLAISRSSESDSRCDGARKRSWMLRRELKLWFPYVVASRQAE